MKFRSALFILLIMPGLAFAAGSEKIDVAKKPSFGKVVNELSRFLSSTNPEVKLADTKKSNTEDKPSVKKLSEISTASGDNNIKAKPMHIPMPNEIDKPQRPKPIPILPPTKTAPENFVIQEPMLSPETKRIFRKTPSNIGVTESASGSLAIQRGKFGEEFEVNESILNNEVNSGAVKPKYEIKVQDTKTVENQISMLDKGLKALVTGQYEGAIAIYKSVLVKQPKNRDALFGLATAYHKAGQRTQARQAYSNLLAKYPNFQDGLNNFLMLASEESPKDALAELEQLSVRNPNFAPIFAQKASIYNKMGEQDKAVTNFIKALLIEPGNLSYKYNLATIYDKNGAPEKARKMYSELLEASYKGKPLPVGRQQISERLEVLSAKRTN
jgi:Flp pilus assembly protein TadD